MEKDKKDIYVFADWFEMPEPKLIGILSTRFSRGKTTFSFTYDKQWIKSKEQLIIDPDINWYSGRQFPTIANNFGVFLDSMPDTWGRTLMKRRAAIYPDSYPVLNEVDYLLGVYDESRMGALRFKIDINGPFLDDSSDFPTPPWTLIRDLQFGVKIIESDDYEKDLAASLAILMAPGSSLGGTRPKANILDENKHPWIAKFPSKNDTIDKALWEYLAYQLALKSGVIMSESKVEKIAGTYHTFFTKRFDRMNGKRIHFASAMTMTANNEEGLRDKNASYLELAEFIQFAGVNIEEDLHQLWRRIVFNIAISNTDDHLRNHGFILQKNAWRLSPAYDINPSIDKSGLALNINMESNALDFDLAKSVGIYFQLNDLQMKNIISEVIEVVSQWEKVAKEIGISRAEIQIMKRAFRVSI